MTAQADTVGRGDRVDRFDLQVRPDPRRVAARVFLPGQELSAPGPSRAGGVVDRFLSLPDDEVALTLETVRRQFTGRHRNLDAVLDENFAAIAHRVPAEDDLTPERRRLLGAYFTREIAIEAAALFNPSVVAVSDTGAPNGSVRFVMSARAVSEGHLSTLVFRGGTFTPGTDPDGVRLDPGSVLVDSGVIDEVAIPRDRLRRQALASGAEAETLDFVLAGLPETVARADLDAAVEALSLQSLTRTEVSPTVEGLRRVVASSYVVRFPDEADLSERTLFPVAADESHGIEDARFVRLAGDGGFAATYTGYDGAHVVSRRLDTSDFTAFSSTVMTGIAAQGKGMALFPRQVGGTHLALSRWDRENNALASSSDGYHWDDVLDLQQPARAWDLVQLGNCGSPLETEAGWLVLTHGVGPLRSYTIGALLLDLHDPGRLVGQLDRPLLAPAEDERDGYVPNVVYSCGGLVHADTLLLPYGCSDRSIRFAVLDLPDLLTRLTGR